MSVLALSPHNVIWRTIHNVKGFALTPLSVFIRRLYTKHPCSGWAPFISWEQGSHEMSLIVTTDPYYNPADDPWYPWLIHIYNCVFQRGTYGSPYLGIVSGVLPQRDFRSSERYLVSTFLATMISTDADVAGTPLAAGIVLRYVLKLNKHDNLRCYVDISQSMDNGATWTGIYHWEIDDATGAVTTSGDTDNDALALYNGLYRGLQGWIGTVLVAGGWYPTTPPYVNYMEIPSASAAVAGTSVSASSPIKYSIDGGATWFRNIVVSISQTVSNEISWGVAQAQAECQALSDSVDLASPDTYYPPGTGPGTGTEFTSGSMTLQWQRVTASGPDQGKMQISYTFGKGDSEPDMHGGQSLWDLPEGDLPTIDTLVYPPVPYVMRVAANLLDTGNDQSGVEQDWGGEAMQIKTVLVLATGVYTVRTRKEAPSNPSTNAPVGAPNDPGDGLGTPGPAAPPETGANDQYAQSGFDTFSAYSFNTQVAFGVPTSLSAVEIALSPLPGPIIALSTDQNPIDTDTRPL